MDNNAFSRLKQYSGELSDLCAVSALLEWDQQTYMPSGAADGRAFQMGTLAKLKHEKATSPDYEKFLAEAEKEAYPPDSFESAFLRKLRRNFEKELKLPQRLVSDIAEAQTKAQCVWAEARADRDFKRFLPYLEKILDLKREYAELFTPSSGELYDALLDDYEEGMTSVELDSMFAPLREELPPLIRRIVGRGAAENHFLCCSFDPQKQLDFCREVIACIGYNFTRGRLDLTEHPFTTSFGLDDVRITTHVTPEQPMSCIFSCIHEFGHALYEQGIDKSFNRTPLADGASLGFHESQSRLWENQIGRSVAFWRFFYPHLCRFFPTQLEDVPLESFLCAVNNVEPSLIRTEADEVTYNLHILLRYDLERELISGRLSAKRLPERWNEGMERYLGVIPGDDASGVLQDVHWSCGLFGYFPTYAVGNLIAAQLYEELLRDHPSLERSIEQGEFGELCALLRSKIHVHGAKYPPKRLLERLFGHASIDGTAFLRYLRRKYDVV